MTAKKKKDDLVERADTILRAKTKDIKSSWHLEKKTRPKSDGDILLEKITAAMALIEKGRNDLDDAIQTYTEIIDDCRQAREYLEAAVEEISGNI